MVDNHVIQTRGFRNLEDENGNITGFEFRLRTKYYKGLWLSQMRIGNIVVDGETFTRENQIWEINGVEYSPDEMLEIGDENEETYWQVNDTATIKLKKQGGLSQGYHEITTTFGWSCNYAPPMEEDDIDLGTNFGGYDSTRKLILV